MDLFISPGFIKCSQANTHCNLSLLILTSRPSFRVHSQTPFNHVCGAYSSIQKGKIFWEVLQILLVFQIRWLSDTNLNKKCKHFFMIVWSWPDFENKTRMYIFIGDCARTQQLKSIWKEIYQQLNSCYSKFQWKYNRRNFNWNHINFFPLQVSIEHQHQFFVFKITVSIWKNIKLLLILYWFNMGFMLVTHERSWFIMTSACSFNINFILISLHWHKKWRGIKSWFNNNTDGFLVTTKSCWINRRFVETKKKKQSSK